MTDAQPFPPFVDKRHNRYWAGQVWPRRRDVLYNRRVVSALLLALAAPFVVDRTPVGELEIQLLASAGLAYAALSFGACITGAVLALTLPSRQQIQTWARTAKDGAKHSNLSDLLFVFTWSALLQLAVAMTCGLAFVLGGSLTAWNADPKWTHIALLMLAVAVIVYAFEQLLVVVVTISQIGAVLIAGINAGLD